MSEDREFEVTATIKVKVYGAKRVDVFERVTRDLSRFAAGTEVVSVDVRPTGEPVVSVGGDVGGSVIISASGGSYAVGQHHGDINWPPSK